MVDLPGQQGAATHRLGLILSAMTPSPDDLLRHLWYAHGWGRAYPGWLRRPPHPELHHARLHIADPEWAALPDWPSPVPDWRAAP